MYNILLWGAGYYLDVVLNSIKEEYPVRGIIDKSPEKWGNTINGIEILPPEMVLKVDFDYIVITILKGKEIYSECKKLGIEENRIIDFWNQDRPGGIFNSWQTIVKQIYRKRRFAEYRLDSAPYEWGLKPIPRILSAQDFLLEIINHKKSMVRFGDGEFEIMRGKERPWFQKCDPLLAKRLKEIIKSDNKNICIGIAQNFLLNRYKDECADGVREYMYKETREAILSMIDMNKDYYDAYVTRPYIIYKSIDNANNIFPLFKKVWYKRNILLVEGDKSRIGVYNSFFEGSLSIRRIICPGKNAWDMFDKIKDSIRSHVQKDDLILISLGPAATVLAYDMACEGFQALDFGQVDDEYEWWLKRAKDRIPLPWKMVAEHTEGYDDKYDVSESYYEQIVAKIE